MMRNILTAVAGLLAAGLLLLLFSCGDGDTSENGATETAGTIDSGGASGMPLHNGKPDITTEPELVDEDYGAAESPDDAALRQGWPAGKPLYGAISAVEGNVLVLAPEVPDFIREQQAAGEPEAVAEEAEAALPAEVRLIVTTDTTFQLEGVVQDANPFGAGDQVVAWAAPPNAADVREAVLLIDFTSIEANWRAVHGEPGGNETLMPGDPRLMLPVYGEIVALAEGLITIKPQLPGEPDAAGETAEPPLDVPDTFSYMIDDETRFMRNGAEVEAGEFEVGDMALVVPREPDPGEPELELPIAALVSDEPMAGYARDEMVRNQPAPAEGAAGAEGAEGAETGNDLLQPGGGPGGALPPTTGV